MRILYLEPFNSGSHAAFTEALTQGIDAEWTPLLLPGRHWKWRARGSAAYFAQKHADLLSRPYDLLFASATLPLADLLALQPQLASIPSLFYFHENQLAYPVQEAFSGERDIHFGFTQMVSALAATRCAFNSRWNMTSFIAEARALLRRMPDAIPPGWVEAIEARSGVLPLPLDLPELPPGLFPPPRPGQEGPIILWNHRWEYDKAPEAFFAALKALVEADIPFRVIVCGQRFRKAPRVFAEARAWLGARVVHWGYAEGLAGYHGLLARADIAVSTAIHEFFGVSMIEATHFGARPLVPDRLAYPEVFPPEDRYDTQADLVRTLTELCGQYQQGQTLRADRRHLTRPYTERSLGEFEAVLREMVAGRSGVS